MKKLLASLTFFLPAVASAATFVNQGEVVAIGTQIVAVINEFIVPLLFAIAFVVFIWGVFQYLILGAGNPDKRKEGVQLILWGIIGFFVMVSVWGMVNLLVGAFDFGGQGVQKVPTVTL
jgi:hypothetical protein